MKINLETEQINNIVAATLMADYKRILSGEYSCVCKESLPAFEQLFEFYLTPQEKREMLTYIVN